MFSLKNYGICLQKERNTASSKRQNKNGCQQNLAGKYDFSFFRSETFFFLMGRDHTTFFKKAGDYARRCDREVWMERFRILF